ncbi:hypothetical protein ACFYSF_39335 [Streptomyces canus]|uniref:hypothetical protein n=1 Tax=Streptomyces canus TaxID=58343 RepID=UPI0036C9BBEF
MTPVVTDFKATRARKLITSEKEANRALTAARAPVGHGYAHLKVGGASPNSAPTPPARPACGALCSS